MSVTAVSVFSVLAGRYLPCGSLAPRISPVSASATTQLAAEMSGAGGAPSPTTTPFGPEGCPADRTVRRGGGLGGRLVGDRGCWRRRGGRWARRRQRAAERRDDRVGRVAGAGRREAGRRRRRRRGGRRAGRAGREAESGCGGCRERSQPRVSPREEGDRGAARVKGNIVGQGTQGYFRSGSPSPQEFGQCDPADTPAHRGAATRMVSSETLCGVQASVLPGPVPELSW